MRRIAIVTLCVLLFACNGEKKRLAARIAALDAQHSALVQRQDDRRNALRDSEQRLASLESEVTGQNTEVQAFMAGHKIAAACIQASRRSWSSDNAYSNDVSAYSRLGNALCGVALLNSEFAREVDSVVDRLREADGRVKDLQRQMAALRSTIDAQRSQLQSDENEIDRVASAIVELRQQLTMQ